MPSIKLQSSDGKVFDVDAGIASVSDTIKSSLEDLSIDERGDQVVSLPNVSSDILEKIISWVTRHKDDPPPPADNDFSAEEAHRDFPVGCGVPEGRPEGPL
ncbi:hypothetical protein HPB48_004073 [Haemaphysalis longicornis]|uniref:SKP1 component POZ domain-containing protein n=1 Tax=Haemaphysalis longicornis TaxID=44386 RepID=A0A9J6GAA9_HAELO|nr:hypothetical protein HPB48_004073 [Haemaphysalis longicornis]